MPNEMNDYIKLFSSTVLKNMSDFVINCLTQRLLLFSQSNMSNSFLFETQV